METSLPSDDTGWRTRDSLLSATLGGWEALPGVVKAGACQYVPFSSNYTSNTFQMSSAALSQGSEPEAEVRTSRRLLRPIGTPLHAGRYLLNGTRQRNEVV